MQLLYVDIYPGTEFFCDGIRADSVRIEQTELVANGNSCMFGIMYIQCGKNIVMSEYVTPMQKTFMSHRISNTSALWGAFFIFIVLFIFSYVNQQINVICLFIIKSTRALVVYVFLFRSDRLHD